VQRAEQQPQRPERRVTVAILNNMGGRAAWIGLIVALPWAAAGQTAPHSERMNLLRTRGVNADITVLPVGLAGRAMPEAGEMLAIFLERGGMANVDWTARVFPRTGEADLQQLGREFGAWVRQGGVPTAYALYAEVLGTPGTGVAEVRAVLADRDGETVWSLRLTPQDEAFRKMQPREPLQCLVMLANALREPLGLEDPFRRDAPEGKLAKRNAERIGLPTGSERAAVRTALAAARSRFAGSRVAVFPVLLDGRPDPKQAAHLMELMNRQRLGSAEAAASAPDIRIQRSPNEQERLWQMARAIREHLRRTPEAADYAVLADYAFAPGGKAFTVHFVVCDGKGEWVIVDFQNDHHADFRSAPLESGDDCDRLVVKRLDGLLRKPAGEN
jgi:hypothetical protein